MNYEESVSYMSGLLLFGIRLDRERFVALLSRLGDPHRKLRCVHVAGTNGKGSTTTFIASILRAAGCRTGAYFSPYVFDLRERIQIDGAMIPKDDFARWVSTVRPEIEWLVANTDLGETTEFELKTAVAFCYFAEQKVDFAVIEVGLGGRLDTTNVIDPPVVAVITNIGLDHTQILGDTLGAIAGEKAGILKSGTVCVTAVAAGEARDAINRIAAERGVPVLQVSCADDADASSAYATFRRGADGTGGLSLAIGGKVGLEAAPLGLRGTFQLTNAATAVTAIRVVAERTGIEISRDTISNGLATASLPGRFSIVWNDDPALVLDVAHNEDGARVLAQALRDEFPGKTFTFVVGMTKNHDPAPFLAELAPMVRGLIVTAPSFRPKPASETAAAAIALRLHPRVREPVSRAIFEALHDAEPGEVVVVTGSLYTVGETPAEYRHPVKTVLSTGATSASASEA